MQIRLEQDLNLRPDSVAVNAFDNRIALVVVAKLVAERGLNRGSCVPVYAAVEGHRLVYVAEIVAGVGGFQAHAVGRDIGRTEYGLDSAPFADVHLVRRGEVRAHGGAAYAVAAGSVVFNLLEEEFTDEGESAPVDCRIGVDAPYAALLGVRKGCGALGSIAEVDAQVIGERFALDVGDILVARIYPEAESRAVLSVGYEVFNAAFGNAGGHSCAVVEAVNLSDVAVPEYADCARTEVLAFIACEEIGCDRTFYGVLTEVVHILFVAHIYLAETELEGSVQVVEVDFLGGYDLVEIILVSAFCTEVGDYFRAPAAANVGFNAEFYVAESKSALLVKRASSGLYAVFPPAIPSR